MPDRRLLLLFVCLLLLSAAAGATYIQPTTVTTTSPPVRIVTAVLTTAPPPGGLSVTSTPAGAAVYLNGVKKGTAPLTVQPLAAGSYDLRVTLDGYQDYTATVAITTGIERRDVVLVPVVHIPTPTPTPAPTPLPPVRILPTINIPVQKVPARNFTQEFRFPQPLSIKPLQISVAGTTKTPRLTTDSPYFGWQLQGAGSWHLPDIKSMPTTYVEVDSYNVYLPQSHLMSNAEVTNDPVWGDSDKVVIDTADRFYNDTNFRWISAENGVTGFYQVSRFPFDSNATHWQNQYVGGLVASGPAKDILVDKKGFHYFSLNFAPIANHNPADPPFYTGVARIDPTVPGKGKPMGVVKVPVINLGVWLKKSTVGPFSVSVPAGLSFIPAGEFTESELGNPNEGITLSSSPVSIRTSTFTELAIANLTRTYYVRVVPIRADGTAGIPTIPVTVTVERPEGCPENPPGTSENDILIKPPSATVASFYMTSFIPDWIHTDDRGKLVSRAYFVTVTPPPYCTAPAATGGGMISASQMNAFNAQLCAQYGGSQPGYHFYADPEETHWYDTVWDIITGIFGAFAEVIHAVSAAWTEIQSLAVQAVALAIQGVTLGGFDCSSSPACTDIISTGLSVAESSLGIPPTLPDVSDIESMGADYMTKVAADELGAGGIVDAAQNVYGSLPPGTQDDIRGGASTIGSDISSSLVSQTGSAQASAAGNFYIPDPLYYQPHPASVMVKVYNPNDQPTDNVTMTVGDSAGLFRATQTYYVPPLAPHDSTVIPVILAEDYTKVYTKDCNADAYTSECADICIPCYWENWETALKDTQTNPDVFSVSFRGDRNVLYTDLSPSSSGKVLTNNNFITFNSQGATCGMYNAKTVLVYPAGWRMEKNGLPQDLWDLRWLVYSFTEGDHGRLIGG